MRCMVNVMGKRKFMFSGFLIKITGKNIICIVIGIE